MGQWKIESQSVTIELAKWSLGRLLSRLCPTIEMDVVMWVCTCINTIKLFKEFELYSIDVMSRA